MPGVDIGAILSAVGGMLLDALINSLANTISQLLTNAISSAIYGLADTLEQVFGVDSWISEALDTFANNLVSELSQTVSTLTNAVNRYAHDTITILKEQKDLSDLLVGTVAKNVDALKKYLEMQYEHQYKTGAAITQYLLQFMVRKPEDYEELGRKLFEIQQELATGDALRAEDAYQKGFEFVMTYLLADLQAVEQMPEEDMKLAAEFIGSQLQEHLSWVREWFQTVVVMPITYANAFRSAFSEGLMMDPDEYAEVLIAHQEAVDRAMAKYAQKLEDQLQHGQVRR